MSGFQLDGYPLPLTDHPVGTQPGLGLANTKTKPGPKLAIADPGPQQVHVALTSPGGIVQSGGYLGRATRDNANGKA